MDELIEFLHYWISKNRQFAQTPEGVAVVKINETFDIFPNWQKLPKLQMKGIPQALENLMSVRHLQCSWN